MRKRSIETDPAKQLAGQIAEYQKEQEALGDERPLLSPDLQEAYESLTPDEIRRELAQVALQPLSRTQGETHIWPLPK